MQPGEPRPPWQLHQRTRPVNLCSLDMLYNRHALIPLPSTFPYDKLHLLHLGEISPLNAGWDGGDHLWNVISA